MTWHEAVHSSNGNAVWDWYDNETGEWTASVCPNAIHWTWHRPVYFERCFHTALQAQYGPEWLQDCVPAKGWFVGELVTVQCAKCCQATGQAHMAWCDSTLLGEDLVSGEAVFTIPLEDHPFQAAPTTAENKLRLELAKC